MPAYTAYNPTTFTTNIPSSPVTIYQDGTPPTVTLTTTIAEVTGTTPFTVTAEFSEDVTGFDDPSGDITVENTTIAGITGGPAVYTIAVEPDGMGPLSISAPTGAAEDAAGNLSEASNTLNIALADITSPVATLRNVPSQYVETTPFTVQVEFDEDVTGFDDLAADLNVENGAATAVSGGPASYTVEITPTGTGSVSITVPAAAAQDLAGNDNTVSDTVTVGSTRVADTQKAISEFMSSRANLLASNQPGLTHLLRDQGCGSFTASASEDVGSVNGCASRGNAWAALSGAWSAGQSYALATVGAHSRISDNLLIGGMLQFDSAKQDENSASGEGWLAGPYFVAKAAGQPLWFEGRLLYGQTNNDISIYGGPSESYETERWLAQFQVSGEIMVEQTKLIPLLDLTYTDDTQLAYTDDTQLAYTNSVGDLIPEQKVQLTQLTAGMEFSTPIEVASGAFTLNGGLKGNLFFPEQRYSRL